MIPKPEKELFLWSQIWKNVLHQIGKLPGSIQLTIYFSIAIVIYVISTSRNDSQESTRFIKSQLRDCEQKNEKYENKLDNLRTECDKKLLALEIKYDRKLDSLWNMVKNNRNEINNVRIDLGK